VKIKVRIMSPGDKPAVAGILCRIPEFSTRDRMVAGELIDSYLKDPYRSGYNILVAETRSTAIGYICYGPTPLTQGTWDIYWMAVAPEEQGRGIGSVLMESAEKKIMEAGGTLALIETSSTPAYEKTRRFHASHGYEAICRIPDFYKPGDDKLILVKKLM
jgi:GNAT superfamily N-acetyltransferase